MRTVGAVYNGPWPEGTAAAKGVAARVAAEAVDVPAWAQARVWARIEAKRDQPRRLRRRLRAFAFAGPALAAAAIVLGLGLRAVTHRETLAGTRFEGEARRLVDVHGAAKLVVGAGSAVAVAEDDGRGVALEVARGSVLASVKHRPAGAPFRLRLPHADVEVVGTVLWVEVAPGGGETVEVARGAVEVTPKGGAPVMVHAGERWPASSTRAPAAADVELLGGAPALEGGHFAAASDAVTAGCDRLPAREAVACLEKLALSDDPLRAESALYEIGWVELRDLGEPRPALQAWQRQRTRFPGGVLRLEADVSIIEALVRLGDDARARREIDAYLAEHPDGIAAPEVHYLRGALDRAAGDCARALPELDLALRTPAEPWAADARAARDACARAR